MDLAKKIDPKTIESIRHSCKGTTMHRTDKSSIFFPKTSEEDAEDLAKQFGFRGKIEFRGCVKQHFSLTPQPCANKSSLTSGTHCLPAPTTLP